MPASFELHKDKKGEFRFRLKASNGQIILASEGYKQRASAMKGIESVRKGDAHRRNAPASTGGCFNCRARITRPGS